GQVDLFYRVLDHALYRRRLRLHPLLRRRARLSCRQAVDLVVHDDVGDVEVPAHRVDEVAEADPVSVAVPAGDDDVQLRVRELGALRDREGPAVERMESVRRQEMREVARATDARDDEDVPRLELERMDRGLEGAQHRKVAASGAPGRLDLRLVGVHLEGGLLATTSRIFSAISRDANVSPSYRPSK